MCTYYCCKLEVYFFLRFSGILRLNHWFLSIYCCLLFPARVEALEQPETLELIISGKNT